MNIRSLLLFFLCGFLLVGGFYIWYPRSSFPLYSKQETLYPADSSWSHRYHMPVFTEPASAFYHSKLLNRPICQLFNGYACVSNRRLDHLMMDTLAVNTYLQKNYIMLLLMVDDRHPLPQNEQTTVEFDNREKKIKTYGDRNAFYQVSTYYNNSQPFLSLINSRGDTLLTPQQAYPFTKEKLLNYLISGKERFNALSH